MDRIKKTTDLVLKHPFLSGSILMIVGSNIANVFAYLYHIIFGRVLEKAAYGDLAAFLALLGLLGTVLSFLNLVIVKFIASSKKDSLPALMRWFARKALLLALVISVCLLFMAPFLSRFLKMSLEITYLVSFAYFFMAIAFVQRSFIQGMLNFKLVVILNNTNLIFRILVGLLFVYFGYSALGAGIGVIGGFLVSSAISLYVLRNYKIFSSSKDFKIGKKILKYSVPMLVASIGTTALLNVDLLMVKYYFSPDLAGSYAAVTVLGKIIFYATAPIASVMFPMISKRYTEGGNYLNIFILSWVLSLAAGVLVTCVYYLFPSLAILPLFGSRYLDIAPHIGLYAVFITLFSMVNLIVNFYQSIEMPKLGMFLPLVVVAQVGLIMFFHETISQVILNLIIVMGAALLILILYFIKERKLFSYVWKK